jgi:5-methyltetrahydropteroyltriglutamate--homocysteine methyltransferase
MRLTASLAESLMCSTKRTSPAHQRRIGEATRFTDLDRLLPPQCGFASTEEGNILAEDEQWAKLRLIVKTAAEIWG